MEDGHIWTQFLYGLGQSTPVCKDGKRKHYGTPSHFSHSGTSQVDMGLWGEMFLILRGELQKQKHTVEEMWINNKHEQERQLWQVGSEDYIYSHIKHNAHRSAGFSLNWIIPDRVPLSYT